MTAVIIDLSRQYELANNPKLKLLHDGVIVDNDDGDPTDYIANAFKPYFDKTEEPLEVIVIPAQLLATIIEQIGRPLSS